MYKPQNPWYGFDLDGTLAMTPDHNGLHSIGEPIPKMIDVIKSYIEAGRDCRIVTARAAGPFLNVDGTESTESEVLKEVEDWCQKHIGQILPIGCTKDYNMVELFDDRAVQVLPNTGVLVQDLLKNQMDRSTDLMEMLNIMKEITDAS